MIKSEEEFNKQLDTLLEMGINVPYLTYKEYLAKEMEDRIRKDDELIDRIINNLTKGR